MRCCPYFILSVSETEQLLFRLFYDMHLEIKFEVQGKEFVTMLTGSVNFSASLKHESGAKYAVRLFETFPRHDLLMLWNSISDHVLLPLLLDGFRKMSIHPELITLSQTRGHGGDNCVSLELKDEFSWCDHPIIKHFPHFLFVIKSISGASGHSVSHYTCVPGVRIMMSTLRVLNPTNMRTTLFPSPSVGSREEDVLIFNDSHPDWKLDVNTGHDY